MDGGSGGWRLRCASGTAAPFDWPTMPAAGPAHSCRQGGLKPASQPSLKTQLLGSPSPSSPSVRPTLHPLRRTPSARRHPLHPLPHTSSTSPARHQAHLSTPHLPRTSSSSSNLTSHSVCPLSSFTRLSSTAAGSTSSNMLAAGGRGAGEKGTCVVRQGKRACVYRQGDRDVRVKHSPRGPHSQTCWLRGAGGREKGMCM